MEKKKLRDCISPDEYWMALAFIAAAKSPKKHAALLTNDLGFIKISKDDELASSQKYDHHKYPEFEILSNCSVPITNCSVYLTYTPDYSGLSFLISAGLRKIVYFKTDDLCEESQDLIQTYRYASVMPFDGNLNWIKDYLAVLEGSGIFVESSHK